MEEKRKCWMKGKFERLLGRQSYDVTMFLSPLLCVNAFLRRIQKL